MVPELLLVLLRELLALLLEVLQQNLLLQLVLLLQLQHTTSVERDRPARPASPTRALFAQRDSKDVTKK